MKKIQKALALLLALCVVAALSPAAFAADYYYDNDSSANVTETLGDLTGTAGQDTVLYVYPDAGGTVTVDAGNVTVDASGNRYGVKADAYYDNTIANLTAGDVSATSDRGYVVAVYARAYPESEGADAQANVTVGDVYANGAPGGTNDWTRAVNALASYGGVTNVTAGDVTAESTGKAEGVSLQPDGPDTAVTVTAGDVVASGGARTFGAYVYTVREYSANESVEANLNLDSISASSTGDDAYGLGVDNYGGNISAVVNGDVSAEGASKGYGLSMYLYGWGESMTDVLVDGTLSGSTSAVELYGSSNEGQLTVWKATLNQGGTVVEGENRSQSEAFEKNILYIIKMDEGAKQQLTLGNTTKSHDFDCAKEGDKVTLTGANVSGLSAEGVTLQQEADGSYSLVVPKGGGVYLHLPVRLVAAAPAPVVDENIIEVLTTGEGIGLRLLRDGSYVLRLADGLKFYGDYELVDGVPVFTLADGSTVTAELDENGNYVFTLPYGEGQTTTFTISPNKLAILIEALG